MAWAIVSDWGELSWADEGSGTCPCCGNVYPCCCCCCNLNGKDLHAKIHAGAGCSCLDGVTVPLTWFSGGVNQCDWTWSAATAFGTCAFDNCMFTMQLLNDCLCDGTNKGKCTGMVIQFIDQQGATTIWTTTGCPHPDNATCDCNAPYFNFTSLGIMIDVIGGCTSCDGSITSIEVMA